jgi:hypothetical protein
VTLWGEHNDVSEAAFNLVLGTMGFTSWQNPVGLKADVVVLP